MSWVGGESFIQRLLSSDVAYNENRVWHQGRKKKELESSKQKKEKKRVFHFCSYSQIQKAG